MPGFLKRVVYVAEGIQIAEVGSSNPLPAAELLYRAAEAQDGVGHCVLPKTPVIHQRAPLDRVEKTRQVRDVPFFRSRRSDLLENGGRVLPLALQGGHVAPVFLSQPVAPGADAAWAEVGIEQAVMTVSGIPNPFAGLARMHSETDDVCGIRLGTNVRDELL